MWKCKWCKAILPWLSLLLGFSLIACSQPSETTQESSQDGQPASQKPAEFEVGPIKFEPSTVMVGDSVDVTATVKNIGDVTGTYTAIFTIDGQEMDKKDIIIEPGNDKEVSFQFSKTSPGTYTLAIGDSSATRTVYDWRQYTIQNEHGKLGLSWYMTMYGSGGFGHIAGFDPPAKPFKIQAIKMCIVTNVQNQSELDKRQVTFRIWNKDISEKLWEHNYPWRTFYGSEFNWVEVEVPDTTVYDRFHVEIVTHSDAGDNAPNCIGLAYEKVEPPSAHLPEDVRESYLQSGGGTGSGWSFEGKRLEVKGRLSGIIWRVRVVGEGPTSN